MANSLSITLAQLSTGENRAANLEQAEEAVAAASNANSDLVVLPENVLYRGDPAGIRATARALPDFAFLADLSQKYDVTTVWGGVPLIDSGKVYNALIAYSPTGETLCVYRKIHLFQLRGVRTPMDETRQYAHGEQSQSFVLNGWNIGTSICYDLRFPELYRTMAGVDLMLCPSSFTAMTGEAHWSVLARARAIENQCYFAAVGQCGLHPSVGVQTYGHTMLVDPWGEVLHELLGQPGSVQATIQRDRLQTVRRTVPALDGRRLY